jgi:hypothetical protein
VLLLSTSEFKGWLTARNTAGNSGLVPTTHLSLAPPAAAAASFPASSPGVGTDNDVVSGDTAPPSPALSGRVHNGDGGDIVGAVQDDARGPTGDIPPDPPSKLEQVKVAGGGAEQGVPKEEDEGDVGANLEDGHATASAPYDAIATWDYEPQADDELALIEGAAYTVLELLPDPGWGVAKDRKSGTQGLIPLNHLAPVSSIELPSFPQLGAVSADQQGATMAVGELPMSAVADFDYDAEYDDELSLKQG